MVIVTGIPVSKLIVSSTVFYHQGYLSIQVPTIFTQVARTRIKNRTPAFNGGPVFMTLKHLYTVATGIATVGILG